MDRLWFGVDPFASFPTGLYAADLQGWNDDHPLLIQAVRQIKPRTVIEIGVWKGRSIITIGRTMRELGLDGVIVAIDTWLGSAEHWFNRDYNRSLRFEAGYPKLYHCFMQNMVAEELQNLVLPLPIDSVNGAEVLRGRGMVADLIHLDGAHDYRSVRSDLEVWWGLLRPGGCIVCDDYVEDGSAWPGLKRAVDEFVATCAPAGFEARYPKCLIVKPTS